MLGKDIIGSCFFVVLWKWFWEKREWKLRDRLGGCISFLGKKWCCIDMVLVGLEEGDESGVFFRYRIERICLWIGVSLRWRWGMG